jgi:hypothetical protein
MLLTLPRLNAQGQCGVDTPPGRRMLGVSGHARVGRLAVVIGRYPLPVPHEQRVRAVARRVPMTPSLSPPVPPDPTCAVCSKPIRSGGFTQTKMGEVVHTRCRSKELRLRAIEQQDRARLTIGLATDLVEETRRRSSAQSTGLTRQHDRCPVCAGPATLTDWRPHLDWMTVEDCPCLGFFVWTPLLDEGRLARLTPEDREILSQRVRHLRATRTDAWLTTRDGTVMGAMIIRSERPAQSRWAAAPRMPAGP